MTIGGWIAFVLFAALILCAGIAGACLIENVLGKIISVAVAILWKRMFASDGVINGCHSADFGIVLRYALVLPEHRIWPAGHDGSEKRFRQWTRTDGDNLYSRRRDHCTVHREN